MKTYLNSSIVIANGSLQTMAAQMHKVHIYSVIYTEF
jgi:hypothetical protein